MDSEMRLYNYAYKLDEASSPKELLETFGRLTFELFRLQYRGKVKLSKRLTLKLLRFLYLRGSLEDDLRRLAEILEDMKDEAMRTKDASTSWFLQFVAVSLQRGLRKFVKFSPVLVRA